MEEAVVVVNNVVIVADQPLSAEGIRRALRLAVGCRVVARVDARRPLADVLADVQPDMVLIDEMSSRRLLLIRIREARTAAPRAKVVLVHRDLAPDELTEATGAGADAAISRSLDAKTFATLVAAIAGGKVFHSFAVAPSARAVRRDGLTPRELEILAMVAGGAANGRIAKSLWVTEQTVKYHLSNIYRKLGVANRTQASHYAHVHGYLGHASPARRVTADEAAA
jgi:DNA-binding NarL/FixJ family response regulator